ncbi:hypothetical protein Y032_0878g2822 [Ancylostoma ceylanicum]|uniref:Uncharacterized protein n=1 Tax=Ancylostoma ceylanicum TaxID=53326 RepID=A0A016WBF3_9BILA|nr:hypothetical protein Y032_0878g2822 [Ancylostoma ceylanicum]
MLGRPTNPPRICAPMSKGKATNALLTSCHITVTFSSKQPLRNSTLLINPLSSYPTAFKTYVGPILEYGTVIFNPHRRKAIMLLCRKGAE